jgi:hypothetical protein
MQIQEEKILYEFIDTLYSIMYTCILVFFILLFIYCYNNKERIILWII